MALAPTYMKEAGLANTPGQDATTFATDATPLRQGSKSYRTHVPAGPKLHGTTTFQQQHNQLKDCMVQAWKEVLDNIQGESKLFQALAESKRPIELLTQSVARYEGSALNIYIGKIQLFIELFNGQQSPLCAICSTQVVDVLLEYRSGVHS